MHHPEIWNLDWVGHDARSTEYRQTVETMRNAIRFVETIAGRELGELQRVDFFTSHEGLHLAYEQAQTRQVPRRPSAWYDLTTHFPWIGERTRQLDGAHVEYFRGIANPIGVKVGPAMQPAELLELIDRLNPANEPGRLTLIHRFGSRRIADCLPPLIAAVRTPAAWCCGAAIPCTATR